MNPSLHELVGPDTELLTAIDEGRASFLPLPAPPEERSIEACRAKFDYLALLNPEERIDHEVIDKAIAQLSDEELKSILMS
jgi:hypothetical protein